jgi:hypothetical protein
MPERGTGFQALPLPCSPPQAGHLRGGRGLINENQPMRFLTHPGLTLRPPNLAILHDIIATDFGGQHCFF